MSQDIEAMLKVGLAAALADGTCSEQERAQLASIARSHGVDPASVVPGASGAAVPSDLETSLPTPEARRAAYELAVAVCSADGPANDAETTFLAGLRTGLRLDEARLDQVDRDATAIARVPVAGAPATGAAPGTSTDDLILQHAMLAGALELLPQSLATVAVIPLQLRLVYLIGQSQGQQLDAAQAKDLLAALGIGTAAQVMEGVARKLIGGVARGVLGRLLGGVTGGVAGAATGVASSFASTWAIGHAAEQYYAQGRQLSAADLQALFARLLEDARSVYPTVQAKIEEQARGLDLERVLASLTRS